MKPVVIEEEAETELVESIRFYERRRAGLGLELEVAAREAIVAIQAAPEQRALRKDGTRRHVMRRFPFLIYYMVQPDQIWVLAFAHASRKPSYWRTRLESK